MNFIERVMRVMTHINIGASLGLMAWVLWSGWQVVTGQIAPTYSAAEVRALTTLAHAGHAAPAAPMRLRPAGAGGAALPPCHELPPAVALKGTDL
jgi:hypothetical protein